MPDRRMDLLTIHADLSEISPYPWTAQVFRPKEPEQILDSTGGIVVGEVGEPILSGQDPDGCGYRLRQRNAQFIADAPSRIADLAGAVERLRQIETDAVNLAGAVLAERWQAATAFARQLATRRSQRAHR